MLGVSTGLAINCSNFLLEACQEGRELKMHEGYDAIMFEELCRENKIFAHLYAKKPLTVGSIMKGSSEFNKYLLRTSLD